MSILISISRVILLDGSDMDGNLDNMNMEVEDEMDVKDYPTSSLGDESWESTIDEEGEEEERFNADDWGARHPHSAKNGKSGIGIRVPFSKAETKYITEWMKRFPNLGVPALYERILNSAVARTIFHAHHVEKQDRIAYIFKSIRKQIVF